jgi:hypothetical protein
VKERRSFSSQLAAASLVERRVRGELLSIPAARFAACDVSAARVRSARRNFLSYDFSRDVASCRRTRSIEVENTGLEPVTSWLQTRRSPS